MFFMQVINISLSRSPEALSAWDPGAGYHLFVFAILSRDRYVANMFQNHRTNGNTWINTPAGSKKNQFLIYIL